MSTCKTCIFYNKQTGQCRRHAPQFNRGADAFLSEAKGMWPLVDEGEGCGEHDNGMPVC